MKLMNMNNHKDNDLINSIRYTEKSAELWTVFSNFSHDIRNPLSIISAKAQMAIVKCNDSNQEQTALFESIENQVLRCAETVKKFFDPTRYLVNKNYYRLEDIVGDSLKYLDSLGMLTSATVINQNSKYITVFCDRLLCTLVFVNIIENAIEAMNNGVIYLKTSRDVNGNLTVEINDSGCGIGSSIEENIYDVFFTTKTRKMHAGLGLAVVKKIINDADWSIRFISKPGNTSFFITIPSGMNS
jgi:two-component system, sporulation sensor kinase E